MWNPDVYLRFADERGRPFHELAARIGATDPRRVVDLGCGPGNLTATLLQRWPQAQVKGIDSSPEMIDQARVAGGGVVYELGDLAAYRPDADVDVIISNAALQWVPNHAELVRQWSQELRPGAWLAFQVPGNYDAPGHRLMRQLCASPRWAPELGELSDVARQVPGAVEWAGLLREAGCEVDAWETNYIHQLPAAEPGRHPVGEWMSGTALRPIHSRLSEQDWVEYRDQLDELLVKAYPTRSGVVDFPFLRVFAVAHRRR